MAATIDANFKNLEEYRMQKKVNTERFEKFVRWLSGALNLPADERQGIRTLKQWRPLIHKYL